MGGGGAIGPSPFFILMTGLRVEKWKRKTRERRSGGQVALGGASARASRRDGWSVFTERGKKKRLIVVLPTNKKEEG